VTDEEASGADEFIDLLDVDDAFDVEGRRHGVADRRPPGRILLP